MTRRLRRGVRVTLDYAARCAVVALAIVLVAKADEGTSSSANGVPTAAASTPPTAGTHPDPSPTIERPAADPTSSTDEAAVDSTPATDGTAGDSTQSTDPVESTSLPTTAPATTSSPDESEPVAPTSTAPTATVAETSMAPAHGSNPPALNARTASLTAIQTVPAIADLVVRIGGNDVVSDAGGLITVPPGATQGDVEVVGFPQERPFQQAKFVAWGDGDTRAVRPLGTLAGPVAHIGFEVSYLVTAAVGPVPPGAATVTFNSEQGSLVLVVGEPTWVVASRVVDSPEGLVAQQLTYSASAFERAGSAMVLGVTCVPAPDALWQAIKPWSPQGTCS